SNLDAKLREGMRAEIRRLQRRLGIAAVYVTHDREEALSMSDRVIVMDNGRIAQIGTPKELYRRPKNRFVADFVGKIGMLELYRHNDAWQTKDGNLIHAAETKITMNIALGAVRPENIKIQAGCTTASNGLNYLHGRISDAQYLGPCTEYVVEVAGATLRAHAQLDLKPDSKVTLLIAPEDIVLLPMS
ncbi:MAG: ABC transporter ATP-binding protein, partial [Acetobacteraceae bacterium]|nr:ABC transporter ATP-binding protein [Acetobacteraceae bacterium]